MHCDPASAVKLDCCSGLGCFNAAFPHRRGHPQLSLVGEANGRFYGKANAKPADTKRCQCACVQYFTAEARKYAGYQHHELVYEYLRYTSAERQERSREGTGRVPVSILVLQEQHLLGSLDTRADLDCGNYATRFD